MNPQSSSGSAVGWIALLAASALLLAVLRHVLAPARTRHGQRYTPLEEGSRPRSKKPLGAPLNRLLQSTGEEEQPKAVQEGEDDGYEDVVPLTWDVEEGGYTVAVDVGKHSVEFVMDSGSSQLSAKGPGCKFTTCDGDTCNTRACPCRHDKAGGASCTKHRYVPTGRRLQPGEEGASTSTTLSFGSQEDGVSHYMENAGIQLRRVSRGVLASGRSPKGAAREVVVHGGGEGEEKSPTTAKILMRDIIVHRIHTIKGTSSSNIIGLSRPLPSRKVVLNSMGADVWGLVLPAEATEATEASEALDTKTAESKAAATAYLSARSLAPRCFPGTRYVDMVWPPELESVFSSSRFYVVPLKRIEVVGAAGRAAAAQGGWGTPIPGATCPRYMILDTGTTCSYASPALGVALKASGYTEGVSGLRFILPEAKGGTPPLIMHTHQQPGNEVALEYTASEMRDPLNPVDFGAFNCDEGSTLPNFDAMFKGVPVILFGIVFMKGFYWEHDLVRMRVGIQKLG